MTDIMSKEQRSRTMSKIRAKSKLEDLFASALWKRGLRFRRNVKSLKGTPDIAIKKYKIVIFVDSCFWHVCPEHFKRPKSNQEFWDEKFKRNVERDAEITSYYIERNWHIKRIWEHEIRQNLEKTVDETVRFIDMAKNLHPAILSNHRT
ncbi:very short patch repair endonuclease [Siminovitchia acidinfaciens]|uniref:Very short patch repair endonuclease n=1 Tax=Siminovitchia acidinfaciens TaxID=2321395 RepID=A0A429Y744_9BACI|nr:very short patch repair endonuclease [Siminovitchia acidinfaciens]RST77279.1 very short patch repair endonuclease [Siminovitchia acidinfaciens]